MFYFAIVLISAFSFLFYSARSILSKKMLLEYSRWGLKKFRITISFIQFLAAFGLIFGLYNSHLLLLASFFLTIMMFIAIIVRVKIKDSFIASLPAIFYMFLNLTIFYITYTTLY